MSKRYIQISQAGFRAGRFHLVVGSAETGSSEILSTACRREVSWWDVEDDITTADPDSLPGVRCEACAKKD